MKIPMQARLAAALAGAKVHEFGLGWANGLARWTMRPASGQVAENPFPEDSTKFAASEAAVTFMRERSR
jgi:hypothetical protein